MVIYATKTYKIEAIGIEINQDFVREAQETIDRLALKNLCQVIEGDLYAIDLNRYDLIFGFFLPDNQRYLQHLIKTIKSGAIIINIKWPMDTFMNEWSSCEILHPMANYPVYLYTKK